MKVVNEIVAEMRRRDPDGYVLSRTKGQWGAQVRELVERHGGEYVIAVLAGNPDILHPARLKREIETRGLPTSEELRARLLDPDA